MEVVPTFGYNGIVAAHFQSPVNTPCHSPGPQVIYGRAGSEGDGVLFRLSAVWDDEHLLEVRFEAYGCPHSIAAASRVTEQLKGLTRAEAQAWSWRGLARELEVPPDRRGRLLVLEDAVRNLLAQWPVARDQRTAT